MKTLPQLHIRSIQVRPVVVPMKRPLRTSSGAVAQAPLLLIDLQAEEGVTGRSYLFGYQPFTLKAFARSGGGLRRDDCGRSGSAV